MSQRSKDLADSSDRINGLTDEEFEARTDDPALIETHEEAAAILRELMSSVASIDMQLEVYRGECEVMGQDHVPAARVDWYRRALHARAYRCQEIKAVRARDRELRGVSKVQPAHRDPAEGIAKQARLSAEAHARSDARRLALATEQRLIAELAAARRWQRAFVRLAEQHLPPDLYAAMEREARGKTTPVITGD